MYCMWVEMEHCVAALGDVAQQLWMSAYEQAGTWLRLSCPCHPSTDWVAVWAPRWGFDSTGPLARMLLFLDTPLGLCWNAGLVLYLRTHWQQTIGTTLVVDSTGSRPG